MSLQLFNSLTRRVEPFAPLDPSRVTMYVCGPTVYNYVHIGNARPYVVFGVLANLLRRRFGEVRYARNITDVDDKINNAACEQGVPIGVITGRFAAAYREDMTALGIAPPDIEPEVTAHIPQIIEMIQQLIANGHAYEAEGHVLFAVGSFEGYGKLSRRDTDEMLAGARVEVAPYKRDPGDFVLWKPSTDDLPGWDSPWGRGRPGWHIECSAMAAAHLGETIDIHAGGVDLQFPHHENEIAQSEGANGVPLAKVWMHNGFVNIDNEKMSKSLGNFFTVREVLGKFDAETLRFFIVRAHYRSPLNYSDVHLDDARGALKRLYTALDAVPPPAVGIDWNEPYAARFKAAMDNDFGTPDAVAVLFDLATEVNRTRSADRAGQLKALGGTLGILQGDPKAFLRAGAILDDATIQQKIEARAAAKKAKDFAEADRIRKDLLDQGIVLKDSPAGTTWEAKQ
jgi:cysteinyl-tRNA synthetase